MLARQVMDRAKPGDTVDERLRTLDPYLLWAQVLANNLRRFRAVGYDAVAAAKLREHAENQLKTISQAHGWPLPPTTMPGVKALDE